MEDKLLSCINFWDTLVNNNHPLQPEEDAEPLCKDAEPNLQPEVDAEPLCKDAEPNLQPEVDAEPLCKDAEPNKQPEEDAEPPARTQSHLEGRRAT